MAQRIVPGIGYIETGYAGQRIFSGIGYVEGEDSAGTDVNVSPDAGAMALMGHAPTVTRMTNQSVIAGAGDLWLTGYAPLVTHTRHQQVQPDTGSFAIAGFAPTVVQAAAQYDVPDAGTLVITGWAPSITYTSQFARAPSGEGYTPRRTESMARPAASGGRRPAALQENQR
jgi:hypothetical protein